MDLARNKIIACKTVINEMRPFLSPDAKCYSVEPGLHLQPENMRSALQAIIDDISADTENIILGYGLCSMGVVGLKATHSTLIIPRRDDCIAIFLGHPKAYRNELNREPGTYFLSKGWIDAGITLMDDLEKMKARYETEVSKRIMKRMLQHYRRLAFIDMGYADPEPYRQFSRKAARQLNLDYQEIRGNPEFLAKICNGPWDDDFVVAPPGCTVTLADFKTNSSGNRQHRGLIG
jgi:hypothetical protein